MADSTRQSLTDRVIAAVVPDSLKSSGTVSHQQARGAVDKVQATLEPESEKSYLQQAADKLRGLTESSSLPASASDMGGSDTSTDPRTEPRGDTRGHMPLMQAMSSVRPGADMSAAIVPGTPGSEGQPMAVPEGAYAPSGNFWEKQRECKEEGMVEKAKKMMGFGGGSSSSSSQD
ncbi:hypothetical protein BCR44DRAFT_1482724 [Catenaria anguillulae PL171]|uniref:Uncharacterized protein n=1 Tax=Catenaria anguillulae PL171 TaxID=765915 RepID=A0A1Y2HXW1_9FUNG|nr:hypothetical protein BCR44DRAFT_1482724 [Catenaria anguillulae PL171]